MTNLSRTLRTSNRIGGAYAWAAWSVITLATVWQFVLQTGYAVVSVDIQKDAQLTIAQVGIAAAVYTWTFGVAQFFSGPLLDRFSSRPLLWMSMILVTVGAFLYAMATDFGILIAAQVVLAIGSSFGFVGAGYVGGKWFKASAYGFMFGLVQTAVALGSAVTQPIMQALLSVMSWQELLAGLGAVGVVLTLLAVVFLRDPDVHPPPVAADAGRSVTMQILADLGGAFVRVPVLLSALVSGATFGVLLAVGTLWGPRLMQAHGADPVFSTVLTGAAWLGLAVGATLLPFIAGKQHDYKWPAATGTALQLVCVVFIIYIPTPQGVTMVLMFAMGMFSGVEMLGFAIAGGAVPERLIGASAAVVNATCFIISGVLTSIPSLFIPENPTIEDFRSTLWLMPAFLAVGVVAALFLPRWKPQPGADPTLPPANAPAERALASLATPDSPVTSTNE